MLFRYNIELHLTYNRMALYDRTPDSEFRVELEKPFVWKINQTVQTKEENGEPKTFSDTYKIELSSVWKENIEKDHMPEPYFRMAIENILGETKDAACEYLSGTVERICKNLTLEITTATGTITSPVWRRTGVMRCGKSRSMSRIWNIWRIRGMDGSFMCGII